MSLSSLGDVLLIEGPKILLRRKGQHATQCRCHHQRVWWLVTAPGYWSSPRCCAQEPPLFLLVSCQPTRAIFFADLERSRVCRIRAGRSFVNRSLLEHSHARLFTYFLWLLSSRVECLQQRLYGLQSWKDLLSGPSEKVC